MNVNSIIFNFKLPFEIFFVDKMVSFWYKPRAFAQEGQRECTKTQRKDGDRNEVLRIVQ